MIGLSEKIFLPDVCFAMPRFSLCHRYLNAFLVCAHEAVSEEMILKPRCLAGKSACPPESCGGVYGYEELKYVFREMPKSSEAKEPREWLDLRKGEIWDADYFNIEATNNRLSQ